MRILSLLQFGAALSLAQTAIARPPNPFLADSPWPISHGHPYNQGASDLAGPIRASKIQQAAGTPVAVTLAVSGVDVRGRRVIWGTTTEEVFKLDHETFQYIDRIPSATPQGTEVSGAYSLVDRDGAYVVPAGNQLRVYGDQQPGNSQSRITLLRQLQVPTASPIVGLTMTWDGRLVFVTESGLVGSVNRELGDARYLLLEDGRATISNSIAADEAGGVYILTDRYLHQVNTRESKLELGWSAPYPSDTGTWPGRLGPGSGTSPTLMGVDGQDEFVAITDGRRQMHMLLFWRHEIPTDWRGLAGYDRRIAAAEPVTFGLKGRNRAATEQSLTASGYGVAAVSNTYGELSRLQRAGIRRRCGDTKWCYEKGLIYLSNEPNIAPYGVEKFEWDPGSRRLRSQWARPDISCPNGIPGLSEASHAYYCIGQRRADWTLEVLDWRSGASRSTSKFPCGFGRRCPQYNSFYAGVQLLGEGTLITGAYGGPMQLK